MTSRRASQWLSGALALIAAASIAAAPPAPAPGPSTPAPTSTTPERPAVKDVKSSHAIPPVPPVEDVPIDPALQEAARAELKAGLSSTDPVIRAHAIEATRRGLKSDGKADILAALGDREAIVRFAAAMAIGDLKLTEAHDKMLTLLDDEDPHVRIAGRYALHRMGDKRFSHYLERTAADPSPGVRGNTALVLGRMEEPSAVKILHPLQRDTDPGVRLQAAEALWRVGDEGGLRTLIAATVSAYPDDQIIAVGAMVSPHNAKVLGHVQACLEADYVQVRLAAARAIGELHPELPYRFDEGYGIALQSARSSDAQERMLAALAMGAIGRPDAQATLGKLLHDKDAPGSPDVRLAAAQAILQLKAQ